MKLQAAFVTLLLTASTSVATEPIPWPTNNESSRVSVDDKSNLMVVGEDKKTTTTVLTLENPKVPSHQYRLVGKIKYQDVAGDGYLEMWNHFSKEGPFFSRTLADEGPFGKITSSSDWRDLEIPFYSKPDMLPTKLIINVVLPGKGKVWISPLTLEKAEPIETFQPPPTVKEVVKEVPAAPASGTSFWPIAAGALSGLVGILGVFIALVSGKPGSRRLTLQLITFLVPTSLASLLVGVLLLIQGANLGMAVPLSVVGGAWLIAFVITAILVRRAICREELRRMQAHDISAN